MALTVCPSCGERKFLEQFQKCTACGHGVRGGPHPTKLTAEDNTDRPAMQEPDDASLTVVTNQGKFDVVRPEPGEACPTCGKRMAMTKAQTQKAYRARKKG